MSAATASGADTRSADQRRSRAVRWAVGIGAAAIIGVGLVLLFLLAQATNNRELYERNYARLFVLNVVVATVLLAVILWAMVRLFVRVRRGRFGSRPRRCCRVHGRGRSRGKKRLRRAPCSRCYRTIHRGWCRRGRFRHCRSIVRRARTSRRYSCPPTALRWPKRFPLVPMQVWSTPCIR